jgi:UDP-N-acetylglucosamine transferase subunit ALG13
VTILRRRRYGAVIGCGANALSFLPVARTLGLPAHFVETATRTAGPSLTGRLLGAVRGVRRYTQHPRWAGDRWLYRGSVFDDFELSPDEEIGPIRRVVVTVGMNTYPFRRLFERMLAILPTEVDVFWQSGRTDVGDLPIAARFAAPVDELERAMAEADVVVAHAGVGSALAALRVGKIPVLVPRTKAFGEQVDDHQLDLADDLAGRALAVVTRVEGLELAVLERASRLRAVRPVAPPPFELAS